jgi:hypothetical protein
LKAVVSLASQMASSEAQRMLALKTQQVLSKNASPPLTLTRLYQCSRITMTLSTAKHLGLSSRPSASRLGLRETTPRRRCTTRLVRTRRSGALQGGIRAKFPSLLPFPANAFVFKTDPNAVARGRRNEFTCWVALRGSCHYALNWTISAPSHS